MGVSQLGGGHVPPLPPGYAYNVGSHEVRSELDILVVLYKSVCYVTVSISEISFSLLARLEAWEWGQQGYCSPIMQSVIQVQFPVQPGWW